MDDGRRHLDTAITALKASRDAIRNTPDAEPADLSDVVATIRELAWNVDSVVKGLADRSPASDPSDTTPATTRPRRSG